MPLGSSTYGTIVVTADPRGYFREGIISGALKPGVAVGLTSASPVLGRYTYGAWSTAFVGPLIVLREDYMQGKTVDAAYTSGDTGFLYFPLPGDELLVRAAAATYTIGQALTLTTGSGVAGAGLGTADHSYYRSLESTTLAAEGFLLVMVSVEA